MQLLLRGPAVGNESREAPPGEGGARVEWGRDPAGHASELGGTHWTVTLIGALLHANSVNPLELVASGQAATAGNRPAGEIRVWADEEVARILREAVVPGFAADRVDRLWLIDPDAHGCRRAAVDRLNAEPDHLPGRHRRHDDLPGAIAKGVGHTVAAPSQAVRDQA
jgi:hypothetical protein